MRSYVISGLFLLLSYFTQAQPGTILIYGSAGIRHAGKAAAGNYFTIAPGIGYQFNENWTIGIDASFFHAPQLTQGYRNWQAGPFIQYFKILNERFGFFTEGVTGIKNTDWNNGFFISVFPAFYVFIGKRWGMYLIPAGIDYSRLGGNNFSFGVNARPLLGISANIPVKKRQE